MTGRWSVTSTVDDGAEPVPFGPMDDTLPSAWTATVDYEDLPVVLTLRLSFDGRRVDLDQLTLTSRDGHSISARDIAALTPDQVIHDAAMARVMPGHGAHLDRRPGRKPTPDELRLVAAVYWFQHVSRGKPRQAVMSYWDVSRGTANRWLRRCRDLFDMPEAD